MILLSGSIVIVRSSAAKVITRDSAGITQMRSLGGVAKLKSRIISANSRTRARLAVLSFLPWMKIEWLLGRIIAPLRIADTEVAMLLILERDISPDLLMPPDCRVSNTASSERSADSDLLPETMISDSLAKSIDIDLIAVANNE